MSTDPSRVLSADDVSVTFRSGKGRGKDVLLRAVDGVSLTLSRGETLGIVGESGSGKTTLVRALLGLHPIASGSVSAHGVCLSGLTERQRRPYRRHMQMVFQDPYSSLDPRMTIGEAISEPLRVNGRYRPEAVAEVLEQVGLHPDMARRKPNEFSGGQRQRIAIARALALQPEILILDEAVSALDLSIQAQILNLTRRLQRRLDLSYLFISHDLSVVQYVSDRVAVMYLGRIVEIGTREQVFGAPKHPYTRSLLSASPVADPRERGEDRIILQGDLPDPAKPPTGCSFRTRCFQARPDCSASSPVLQGDGRSGQVAACFYPLPPPVRSNAVVETREPGTGSKGVHSPI